MERGKIADSGEEGHTFERAEPVLCPTSAYGLRAELCLVSGGEIPKLSPFYHLDCLESWAKSGLGTLRGQRKANMRWRLRSAFRWA